MMFVVKVPLDTSEYDQSIFRKRFNVSTHFYNAVLGEGKRRVRKLKSLSEWSESFLLRKEQKKIQEDLKRVKGDKKRQLSKQKKLLDAKMKELWIVLRDVSGFSEGSLVKFGQSIRNGTFIEQHTTANECNNLTKRAYAAAEKLLFYKAKRVNFRSLKKKSKSLCCIADGGSSSSTFHINVGSRTLSWKCGGCKLTIPLCLRDGDSHHDYILAHPEAMREIKLVRKNYKNIWTYYVHISMEGSPPNKLQKLGVGKIGIDIGPSLLAYSSPVKAELKIFCSELSNLKKQSRILERRIDRQRRSNNPDCYEPDVIKDGKIIKKGKSKKGFHPTKRSKRQIIMESRLSEIRRKEAEFRRCLHGREANDLRRQGDSVWTEKLNIKSWQKRKKSKKGTRKSYGKSIGRHAPAAFLGFVKNKFENTGGTYNEIPIKMKFSQTCKCGHEHKKSLKDRIHNCKKCGYSMQRDLLASVLPCTIKNDMIDFNEAQRLCEERGPLLGLACSNAAKICDGRVYSSNFGSKSELEQIASNVVQLPIDATSITDRA